MLRRMLRGKSILQGDRDHIHHRMVRMGFTPSRVVIILYGVAALFGAFSLLTMTGRGQVVGVVIIAFSLVTWVGIQQLGYSEFSELHRQLRQRLFQDPRAVVKNIYLVSLKAEFQEAPDLGALWSTLTTTASRVDFSQVEIALPRPARDKLMLFERQQNVPPGFPRWRAPAWSSDLGEHWSWTIPILDGDTLVAELRMSRPLRQKNDFELSHLLAALLDGFAPRLVQILDESHLRHRGRPVDSLGRQPAAPSET